MRLATDHSGARQHRHNDACFGIAPLVQGQSRECVFYSTLLAGCTTLRQQGVEVLGRGGGGSTATLQYSLQAAAAHAVATGAPEGGRASATWPEQGSGLLPEMVWPPRCRAAPAAAAAGRQGRERRVHDWIS